jgi:hypothetical protein
METLTEIQTKVLNVIREHQCKGYEITGSQIMAQTGIQDRDLKKVGADIRSIINSLRKKGLPILANGNGYYYSKSTIEIKEYIESFRGRIRKQQEALAGLEKMLHNPIDISSLPDCTGCTQQNLWDLPQGITHQCGTKQHPFC